MRSHIVWGDGEYGRKGIDQGDAKYWGDSYGSCTTDDGEITGCYN